MFLLLNCKIYWIHHYVHYPILQHVDHGDPAAIFRLHLGIQCTNVYVFFFLSIRQTLTWGMKHTYKIVIIFQSWIQRSREHLSKTIWRFFAIFPILLGEIHSSPSGKFPYTYSLKLPMWKVVITIQYGKNRHTVY